MRIFTKRTREDGEWWRVGVLPSHDEGMPVGVASDYNSKPRGIILVRAVGFCCSQRCTLVITRYAKTWLLVVRVQSRGRGRDLTYVGQIS